MKNKFQFRKAGSLALVLTMILTLLASCGSKNTNSSAESKSSSSQSSEASATKVAAGEKTKLKVGIGNMFTPFCYLDDDDQPTGYDYDVMMAISEKLGDKYEFVVTPDDFSNLLIGLDTGKYDVAVHHFGYTAERAENYLYAKEADMYFGNFRIGFSKDRTDITDLASAAGKTIATTSGSMSESLLLKWNEENPDQAVKLQYIKDNTVVYQGITSGLYDAFVGSQYDLDTLSEQYDGFMKYSDYNVTTSDYDCGAYFVYSKGSDAMQQDIDAALVELREDGTLKALSETWLGADYTENPNA
ncbi:transporter substrate-binding domain-containing protein [Scatolibacter rhodanostii]|uniref:transporter substrate-binding domain-containing protein n=1 Tax=Scatolibacter rhodanostii TaxID=2014781 RepID=UPI000C083EFB|nr:transporter substrate-binding domain-containing protein [Scatolibacter rhodanostii]